MAEKLKYMTEKKTMVDLLFHRNKVDSEVSNTAVQRYIQDPEKTAVRLMKYAKIFHVERKVKGDIRRMAVKNITMSVLTRLKQQAKMEELISRSTKDIDFMVYRLSKENLDSIDRKSKNVIQLYYKGDDIMAKEATLQVRMDAELKEKVEGIV